MTDKFRFKGVVTYMGALSLGFREDPKQDVHIEVLEELEGDPRALVGRRVKLKILDWSMGAHLESVSTSQPHFQTKKTLLSVVVEGTDGLTLSIMSANTDQSSLEMTVTPDED